MKMIKYLVLSLSLASCVSAADLVEVINGSPTPWPTNLPEFAEATATATVTAEATATATATVTAEATVTAGPDVSMLPVPKWGIDQLAGGKYKDVILKSHPRDFAIGIFTQESLFTDALPVIDELLAKQGSPLVKYSLDWDDGHNFRISDFPSIVAEARRVTSVIRKYPRVNCRVIPAVEHQLNLADAQALANQVLAVIPRWCVLVNNPYGRGALLPVTNRIMNEVHNPGTRKPKGRYSYSYDGSSAVDSNVSADKIKFADAETFYLWHPSNNGRLKVDDKTPRAERKAWPTVELIESLVALVRRAGSGGRLDKGYLFKSHADRHVTPPENRAYKPVIIAPVKVDSIEVGSQPCKYSSPFIGGGYRYYCNVAGFKIANKIVDVSTVAKRFVREGGVRKERVIKKKIGQVNPAFRCCTFR